LLAEDEKKTKALHKRLQMQLYHFNLLYITNRRIPNQVDLVFLTSNGKYIYHSPYVYHNLETPGSVALPHLPPGGNIRVPVREY